MDIYQQYIYKSRYARFLPEKNRREHYEETVTRYLDFLRDHLKEKCNYNLKDALYKELFKAIFNLEVMPSMRGMMTAGKAAER